LLFGLFGCYLCCSVYCLCVNVYCHRVTTQLQLINILLYYFNNISKWQMRFNSAFKGLTYIVANRWLLSQQNYYISHTEFSIQKTSFKQRVLLYESTSAHLKLKTNFETNVDFNVCCHACDSGFSINEFVSFTSKIRNYSFLEP
jgi:hypothetical protein